MSVALLFLKRADLNPNAGVAEQVGGSQDNTNRYFTCVPPPITRVERRLKSANKAISYIPLLASSEIQH